MVVLIEPDPPVTELDPPAPVVSTDPPPAPELSRGVSSVPSEAAGEEQPNAHPKRPTHPKLKKWRMANTSGNDDETIMTRRAPPFDCTFQLCWLYGRVCALHRAVA